MTLVNSTLITSTEPLTQPSVPVLHPLNQLETDVPATLTLAATVLGISSTAVKNRLTAIGTALGLADGQLWTGTNSKLPTPLGWSILKAMPAKKQAEWLDTDARVLFQQWLPLASDDSQEVFQVEAELVDDESALLDDVVQSRVSALVLRADSQIERMSGSPISLQSDLGAFGDSIRDLMFEKGRQQGLEIAEAFAEGVSAGVNAGMGAVQGRLAKGAAHG